ncbi:MAG: type II toxin-antitoxin system HicB family antitoxin [Actinomycetota bacterium]|nr:type II toxin-antitoxin system HicB family antitoxin [Actinomycetota bacterium]
MSQVIDDPGEPVPEPMSSRTYSGRFNLRLGEQLHPQARSSAAEQRLSLNQYVIRRLSNAS